LATNVPTTGSSAGGGTMSSGHHQHHFEADLSYISSKIIGMI